MSGTSFAEEEFQAHLSFAETVTPSAPIVGPYGAVGAAGALGGREYRAIVTRLNPIDDRVNAAAGVYYITTDYDVAMADLDHEVNVVGPGGTLRVGQLLRIGSLSSADGRVRGVYGLQIWAVAGVAPSDALGGLVTVTMKRVNPNIAAP